MNRRAKSALLMAGLAALLTQARTAVPAYLEPGDGTVPDERPPPPPETVVRPLPRPEPGDPVADLIRRVVVGQPYRHKGLTVYPLSIRHAPRAPDIRTLDEAAANRWLAIREADRARVSTVQARNVSGRHVLLMAGEIVAGGRQNRLVKDDVLLPPRSGWIEIPVYCGEKERWVETDRTFAGSDRLAHAALRRSVAMGAPQASVWDEIDAYSRKAGVESRTRDYQQVYDDDTVRRGVAEGVARLRPLCRPQTVGLVAAVRGHIIGCDLFSDPDLCARLWGKLTQGYVADALHGGPSRRGPPPGSEVQRFLDGVLDARRARRDTPGAGYLLELRSSHGEGVALIWSQGVVHLCLFAPHNPAPIPVPLPRRHALPDGEGHDRSP